MTKKPKTLTDITNVFHPRALTEEQEEFYQPTAAVRGGEASEFHAALLERIVTSSGKSHLLIVGHGGCGKSTELRMLALKLRKEGRIPIIIEARDDLDINNFSYIDILMLIVERLTKYAHDHNLQINKRIIASFREALSTKLTQEYWESNAEAGIESSASVSASLPFFFSIVSKITASFKVGTSQKEELRRQFDPKMTEIVSALNALVDEINGSFADSNGKKIVIIIDGLEKCRSENAYKLFRDDISSLAAINTNLIVACPINIYRSPIANTLQGYFVRPDIMPMIKVHECDSANTPYEAGINVIRELILKRVDASFFEEGVLKEIITMAGGSLRDTCHLLAESAFEAHMYKRETVDMASVEHAMNKFARDLFFRADNKYFALIKKIFDGDRRARSDADLAELLYAGVVFEYNREDWIDLHPLIRQYIEKRPGVLDP